MKKKLSLISSKLGVKVLKQAAEEKTATKGIPMMTVTKEEIANLILDYLAMHKLLRKHGVVLEQPKHYSEEPGFRKPLKESEILLFLRKDKPKSSKSKKRKRVKL